MEGLLDGTFIGNSAVSLEIKEFAQRAASADCTLILRGETGSGKDHLAQCIHNLGRSKFKFVPVNCGVIPEHLCESELFGHKAGAFTDAKEAKVGLVKIAENGTLFLNEIANMSEALQVKFLGLLDFQTFRPVGGIQEITMKTRIIAATNADLEYQVQQGRLREDLYHRLNVISFTVPPLRDRKVDIADLAKHFLAHLKGGANKHLSGNAIALLQEYNWPGNVRQLRNIVEKALFSSRQEEIIDEEHICFPKERAYIESDELCSPSRFSDQRGVILPFSEIKRNYLVALFRTFKNKSEVTRLSGLGRATVYRYLQDFKTA